MAETGRHGDRVKLIRRKGGGVLVELSHGERGWVTLYFIKEYRQLPMRCAPMGRGGGRDEVHMP